MRIFVDVDEAAKRLEELIELALRGDEVLICRAGKPVAELTAIPKPKGRTRQHSARRHLEPRRFL